MAVAAILNFTKSAILGQDSIRIANVYPRTNYTILLLGLRYRRKIITKMAATVILNFS